LLLAYLAYSSTLEMEAVMFLRNVSKLLPDNMASHPFIVTAVRTSNPTYINIIPYAHESLTLVSILIAGE
jgi:hypothetical protein